MPEFFLELFSEEIPARMQAGAAAELERICRATLNELSLANAKTFSGPRRIAFTAEIAAEKPGGVIEARGPRDSAPEAALTGFLAKNKATKEDLVSEAGYYWLRRKDPPVPAHLLIAAALPAALAKFSWPKSMRWGQSGDFTWVRPLRRILCLLDGQTIPITLGPVTAANETEGHHFLNPGAFAVSSSRDWQEKLRSHNVIVDRSQRLQAIVDGLKAQAETLGLSLAKDDALLDEVTGLVEWPVPLIGKISPEYMELPPEVRELSMKVNQRYFALRNAAGNPAPYFAFVANIEAPDFGATIIAGNERVLRARLADARHFWELDLKTPLDALLPKLDKITFHAKIGTQGARAKRISALAARIALQLGGDTEASFVAERAGLLAKADLVTGMVGEFPELQGIMGGYYAAKNPRDPHGAAVGPAIRTHYQPKGPNDEVPTGIVPVSVALADKLDTLKEFFRIGEKPTGSGDPYALRRAALGVIRIILENRLTLPLVPYLADAPDLFDFIIERLRVKLRGEGQRFDILDAILSAGTDDDLNRLMQRVQAVTEFLTSPDGANLLAAYRRAANILRIEDAKDGPHTADTGFSNLGSPEADDLRAALSAADIAADIAAGNYAQAMAALAQLRAPVDAFFDKVTVNVPDPELRRNRLQLLAKLRDTMHLIADFSKIEG
jgi:glycyl-tRNA synthetase beta chain